LEGKEGEEKGKKKRGMKGRVVASQWVKQAGAGLQYT
jgi:hypothetical protein